MSLTLFLHELRLRRNTILAWAIPMGLFFAFYLSFFPTMADQMTEFDPSAFALYDLMGLTGDIAQFNGYVTGTLLNFFPIILGIFVMFMGTFTLSGEEEQGTLELLVTLPVPRWQLALAKLFAILTGLVFIVLVAATFAGLTFLAIRTQFDNEYTFWQVFSAFLNGLPIAILFLALAMFLAAVFPTRGPALGIGIVLIVGGFFANNLFRQIDTLKSLRLLTPFYYYDFTRDGFGNGFLLGPALPLLIVALVLFAAAFWAFNRRPLTTGLWPWQMSARR